MDMEVFDSGWDEPSSIDSENLNSCGPNDAMNGYEPSELQQQMLEMRDDPAMSYHAIYNVTENSAPDNKDRSSVDCSSLSSEIFLATRLLHDETLDSTTLTTLAEPDSSPYNGNQNFNNYLGSPLENDNQQDTADSIGLPQQQALDSEFLYSSFEQLSADRQDVNYDEECSNKSWADSLPTSGIMPAPIRAMSRKNNSERKPKGERKKRIIKVIKKKPLIMDYTEVSKTESTDSSKTFTTIVTPKNNNKVSNLPVKGVERRINFSNIPLPPNKRKSLNVGICGDLMTPSTSGSPKIVLNKDGRKVPSYLTMYRLKDNKYPDIYACKNCYGIFTTLDSAIFHPCLKKRRGRRPKILEDCVVPL